MSKDYMVMSTNESDKRIDEILNATSADLNPDNTIGDYLTELLIALCNEWFGQDMMDKTIAEIDANEETKKELFNRLTNNKLGFRFFGEITTFEELMK